MSETGARGFLSKISLAAKNAVSKVVQGAKNTMSEAIQVLQDAKEGLNDTVSKVAAEAKNIIIQKALYALFDEESEMIIKLINGEKFEKNHFDQEGQLVTRAQNIISSISTFLTNHSDLAKFIIDTLVNKYGETLYNAEGTRNIILQLSEIDTVKLNNKDGFLTKIENYLYRQNDRKLSANDKTNMIKILQLIIDVLKILLVLKPSPFSNESDDKTPGTIATETIAAETIATETIATETIAAGTMAVELLISVLMQILGKSKNSFNVKRDEEDVTYKWNEDMNSFTPYTDPFASNCDKVVVMRDVKTEADSNNNLNVMVFLIVLLKKLTEKLITLRTNEVKSTNSEGGGRNKKYRKTKKTKRTKKTRKTKSTR